MQRQFRTVDLNALNSENADYFRYENRQRIIENCRRAISGGKHSPQVPYQFNQPNIDD